MSEGDAHAAPPGDPEGLAERTSIRPWMILLIAVLGVGVRFVYVSCIDEGMLFPDEKQYWNISENFLKGEGLIVSRDSRTGEQLHFPLEIRRPPAYPLMLAFLRRANMGVRGVRLVQALLGALTCVMIYVLATELVGEKCGRIAGFIAAVYPFYVYFTGRILSETLFLLLFVTSWYYLVKAWNEVGRKAEPTRWVASCLIAGLLGAAAALTRPEALTVFVLVPVVWLVVGPRRIPGFAAGVLVVAALAVGMLPWVVRNYWITQTCTPAGVERTPGRLVITSLGVGESLYEAVGSFATGGPNKENTVWPPRAYHLTGNEYARDRLLLEKSLSYMKTNPERTLRLAWRKFLRTWNVIPNFAEVRTPFYITVSLVSYVPVLVSAILGLVVSLKRPRVLVWVLLPVVVITLTHMVFVGSVRYRLVMMPFVMVLSAVGAWWVICKVFKPAGGKVEDTV